MTTSLAPVVPPTVNPATGGRRRFHRSTIGGAVIALLGLLDIAGFGLQARPGHATFGLTLGGRRSTWPR